MDEKLLKELTEASGVSGNEGEVRRMIERAIADRVEGCRVDALGNLIAFKRGAGGGLKVMVAAHMDEVGLMITRIEKAGYLRFRKVGGIDDRVLLSKAVNIGEGKVPGVIGVKPIHLLKGEERRQVVKVEGMTIDIGVSSKEEAERLVKPGDYVAFATSYEELGESSEELLSAKGKAFDDRAGCVILVELLREQYPFDFYAAFTVQEEVGLRGAKVAAYAVEPDFAFALEGTVADDLPKEKDVSPTTELGKGPAITIMDRSFIADKRLVKLLVETAEREGIPYQIKAPGVGGTDAGAIHLSREGVPSATVAVPCRYLHSPVSLIRLADLRHTIELMKAALPGVASLP